VHFHYQSFAKLLVATLACRRTKLQRQRDTRRWPGRIFGHPLAALLPGKARLRLSCLQASELECRGVRFQRLDPGRLEKALHRLAAQAADFVTDTVQHHARLWAHGADNGFTGHQVLKQDGGRIRRQANDAAHEAVVQYYLAAIRAPGDLCFEGGRIKQPVNAGRRARGEGPSEAEHEHEDCRRLHSQDITP
jgi:hypothetical protein